MQAQTGRETEAKLAVRALLRSDPTYTLKRIPLLFNYRERDRVDEVAGLLQKVGVPE